jgi:hypothetical protein
MAPAAQGRGAFTSARHVHGEGVSVYFTTVTAVYRDAIVYCTSSIPSTSVATLRRKPPSGLPRGDDANIGNDSLNAMPYKKSFAGESRCRVGSGHRFAVSSAAPI